MSYHKHVLAGCAPAPLAHYLKALGILRLVSEQKDPSARGAWRDDRFVLLTTLTRDELERFFLEEYQPTAIFNPWGARSGFYPGSSESSARTYLNKLMSSKATRLAEWHVQTQAVKDVVEAHKSQKPEDKDEQYEFIAEIAASVRGTGEEWLAASVPFGSGSESLFKPPIVGTGGNEGSGSYTSAYLQALAEIIVDRKWDHSLAHALDCRADKPGAWAGTFGQFLPTSAGTAWDLVLALEGAVCVRSGVVRRLGPSNSRSLSSPFLVSAWIASVGSGSQGDEFEYRKGKALPGRGEQWFPLWQRLATLREIRSLFDEGRALVRDTSARTGHGRVETARTPRQFARAVAALGLARGVSEFQRFGYLQRNNLATHFAVPLGRIPVAARPRARLVDEIAPWLDRLHRAGRGKGAPARLAQAERRLSDAVFAALTHDDSPGLWQGVLRAAVAIEQLQSMGTGIEAGLLPKLTPDWLAACDDRSAEFRLALALGSAAGAHTNGWRGPVDPIRHHWLSLTEDGRRLNVKDKRLAHDVRVVAHGVDPEADLLAVLERRTIESAQEAGRHPQITAAPGLGACPADLAAWLAGGLDSAKVVQLGRAFMAVDWVRWPPRSVPFRGPSSGDRPDDAWCALRLNALPWPLGNNCDIPFDPAIARRLASGNLDEAVRLALRRLLAHGIRPTVRFGFGDAALARRWGAALSFPISHQTALQLREQIDPQHKEPRHDR